MAPRGRNFVTYFRVSTQKQGRSGLGLDAQKAAARAFLIEQGGQEIATFTEIESGKRADRPQLQAALLRCRQTRSTLLVAKLDRLSRNAAFLLTLRDAGTRFVAADLPDMNELTVGVLALIAQHEREAISQRTKAALAAAKARGVKLGGPRHPGTKKTASVASQAYSQQANIRAEELRPVIDDAIASGRDTLRSIAAHLEDLSIPTARGGATWTATAVARVLGRLQVDRLAV
jgi:DNA invertase Pin-like site-specific DNA recombinase